MYFNTVYTARKVWYHTTFRTALARYYLITCTIGTVKMAVENMMATLNIAVIACALVTRPCLFVSGHL